MDHSTVATAGVNASAIEYNSRRVDSQLGWMAPTIKIGSVYQDDSWAYSSVSGTIGTVTVTSDGRTRYCVGQKVRLKQGGAYKYFTIIAVNDTTLDITAGSDYTLTNAAITDLYVAIVVHPLDWPWTNNTYRVRSTPVSEDLDADGGEVGFTNWDLSSIVGSRATRVHLWVRVKDDTVGSYMAFRKDGESGGTIGLEMIPVHPPDTSNAGGGEVSVECSTSQIIEYSTVDAGGAAITEARATVIGWWEPA